MQAIYLTSFLFHRVLESELFKVVLLMNHPVTVGEKVAIVEDPKGERRLRTPMYFRYISKIGDCEYMTDNEIIVSIELSASPIPSTAPQYGYQLHL